MLLALWIVLIVCMLWIAVLAARRDGAWPALACLFFWPYALYYALKRWDRCWPPTVVAMAVGAIAVMLSSEVDVQQLQAGWRKATSSVRSAFAGEDVAAARLQRELDQLQGVWNVDSERSVFYDGMPAIGESLVIEGDRCLIVSFEREEATSVVLAPDHSPKWIDLVPDGRLEPLRGVYLLTGDTCRLCLARPGGERPKYFGTDPGEQWLFVLKRGDTDDDEAAQ